MVVEIGDMLGVSGALTEGGEAGELMEIAAGVEEVRRQAWLPGSPSELTGCMIVHLS
jgi:hypothetical protein